MEEYTNKSIQASVVSDFIRSVYSYMFIALSISGLIAYAIGSNKDLFDKLFITADGSISILFYVLLFAPIVISMIIQWGFKRLSMEALLALFVLYSASMGSTLSLIFMQYSQKDIAFTFFCYIRGLRWNGHSWLYYKNRLVQIWEFTIHGVDRNDPC